MTDAIRRKIDRAKPQLAEGAPGADRGWRLGLARAARDLWGLDLEFRALSVTRASLAEVLEVAPERALVALLDGPAAGLGVLFIAPAITSAVIEMQTIGRLSSQAPAPRKPTRIDAAMAAALIDRALIGMDEALADEADAVWAAGFRYASHLDDARPLALLLEDEGYRLLTADISVGQSGRTGQVILVLPAAGRGAQPLASPVDAEGTAPPFSHALAEQVLQAEGFLDAVIARLRLPLGRIMTLTPAEVLPLPMASLEAVSLETLAGQGIARARLGQNRGMRALKLGEVEGERKPAHSVAAPVTAASVADGDPATFLRAAG